MMEGIQMYRGVGTCLHAEGRRTLKLGFHGTNSSLVRSFVRSFVSTTESSNVAFRNFSRYSLSLSNCLIFRLLLGYSIPFQFLATRISLSSSFLIVLSFFISLGSFIVIIFYQPTLITEIFYRIFFASLNRWILRI